MNSESVDLIYLDPPFNSNRNYSAPIGSEAAGAAFKDMWTLDDLDEAWHVEIGEKNPALYYTIHAAGHAHGKGMKAYLIMMSVRLLEMKRLLKNTGSIYLHCDPTANSYLRLVMDCVFGKENFRNEVVWGYSTGGISKKHFARKHDSIYFYGAELKNAIRIPSKDSSRFNLVDEDGRRFYEKAGNRYYLDNGVAITDVWDLPSVRNVSPERTGYPTQKPLALLERIIKASSNEGDTVLDPFCGCATTLIAAEKLVREWAGIDLSPKALELVQLRAERELGIFGQAIHREDIPGRTDLGKLPHYRTHKTDLYGKQGGYCAGCGTHFEPMNMEVDHIVARSKGGHDNIENLQLLCGGCNKIKGTKPQEYLMARLAEIRG